jgi:hypothetical protein
VEHRWGERLSVRARVALRVGGLQGIGHIRDVSVSGARLVTGLRASPLAFVRVVLPAASSATSISSIEGQVVRHTDDGFAIEWCELAPEVVRAFAPADVAVAARIEHEIWSIVRSVSAR